MYLNVYIMYLNVFEYILKVLECINSVVKPKYFYKPLLLMCWTNPELPSPTTGF
jgi:hypothetical protein